MMNNVMWIYGFGGAKDAYKPIWYIGIPDDSVSIRTLIYEASMLKARMPNIEEIYVVDSRPGLAGDYKSAIKKNSIESYVIFKDLITKSGIKLL